MSHTEGRLTLEIKNVAIADTGDYDGVLNVKDSSGKIIFQIWNGEDEEEANARRLVACWNACSTIPTDVLESGTVAGVTPFYLIKERDELLKAFRDLYTEVMVEFAYCPDPVKFESILDKYEGTDHAK